MKHTPWKVRTVSGAAGGITRTAIINLEIKTKSDTVEEIRQLVEATPDLLIACEQAFAILKASRPPTPHTVNILKTAITRATDLESE